MERALKDQFQRWTSKRKVELILQIMKCQKTLVEVCREQDLKQSEARGWIDTFVKSGEQGLKTNSKDQQAKHERELKELRAKVGELVLELDARKKLQALIDERETNY